MLATAIRILVLIAVAALTCAAMGEAVLSGEVRLNGLDGPVVSGIVVSAYDNDSTVAVPTDSSGRFALRFRDSTPGDLVRLHVASETMVPLHTFLLWHTLAVVPETRPAVIALSSREDREARASRCFQRCFEKHIRNSCESERLYLLFLCGDEDSAASDVKTMGLRATSAALAVAEELAMDIPRRWSTASLRAMERLLEGERLNACLELIDTSTTRGLDEAGQRTSATLCQETYLCGLLHTLDLRPDLAGRSYDASLQANAGFPSGYAKAALHRVHNQTTQSLSYYDYCLRAAKREADTTAPASTEVQTARQAMACRGKGDAYRRLGRLEDALVAYRRELELRRELAEQCSDTELPHVAEGLSRVAELLGNLHDEEAAQLLHESLGIRRILAARAPDLYRGSLATTLNETALTELRRGLSERARPLYDEALLILRELATTSPENYQRDLARTLIGLGTLDQTQKRSAQAAKTLEEALAVSRLVAERDPTQRPLLGWALGCLVEVYQDTKNPNAAKKVSDETVALYRELVKQEPQRRTLEFTQVLYNHGVICTSLNLTKEAIEAYREAVSLIRPLTGKSLHEPDSLLADILRKLGFRYLAENRWGDARLVFQEAVSIYRRLGTGDLAYSLHGLGMACDSEGRTDEAVDYYGEALALHRKLATADPCHVQSVADTLADIGIIRGRAGQTTASQEAFEEALHIYRKTVEHDPAVQPRLANLLANMGFSAKSQRQFDKAQEYYEEALQMRIRLAANNPEPQKPLVGEIMICLCEVACGKQQYVQALDAAQKALVIYRDLATRDPARYRVHVARSLSNVRHCHEVEQRVDKAREAGEEAVSIFREISRVDPRWKTSLAEELEELAAIYRSDGRANDSEKASNEAQKIRIELPK